MKKRVIYSELMWLVGLVTMACGTALSTICDFGVSMVVAPAYLLHLKLSQVLPFFSFGMAEYTLQAALLIAMMLVLRKAKWGWAFSVVTAVVYGLLLDGFLPLLTFSGVELLPVRIAYFILGGCITAFGVSCMFHTALAPEVYELFVREVATEKGLNITKFKTGYDVISLLLSVALSFLFFGFGRFEGVKWGTVVLALVNGKLIGLCSNFLEKRFEFRTRSQK